MARKKKSFPFFLWHRRLGLAGLVLLFVLSITGIMLNHTEDFELDKTSIKSDLLLDWYNINPQGKPTTFKLGNIWISQWNQQLFLNGKTLYTHAEKLQGITILDDIIAIALQHHVLLTDTDGEIIELIPVNTHSAIHKIATSQKKIALLDKDKNFYLSDAQLSHWNPESIKPKLNWSEKAVINETQLNDLKMAYRGDGLNLEKFILDLHSGRIFNDTWGIYIMDATAILMILLGISGIWIWWSRKLKIRRKKHFQKHH